jgi:ABC-type dipeptide/oligopeptide/nickel transport system ATPase component
MVFACEWENTTGQVAYQLELYALSQDEVGCQEKMDISLNDAHFSLEQGYAEVSQQVLLQTQLENAKFSPVAKQLGEDFFQSLTQVYSYSLHPTFLKGLAKPLNNKEIYSYQVNIARDLSKEGANFQALLKYVVRHDKETYERLVEFLKFTTRAFHGLVIKDEQVFWQFDITQNQDNLQDLPSTAISDGMMKGCALVLLCALKNPPALLMIDEVEHDISLENVRELLSWLRYASGNGQKMQFLLITHNPTFICEFSDYLDGVYNVSMVSNNYKSLLANFNEALLVDVKMERVNGDITEKDGKELVRILHYQLMDLFYSGVLLNL